MLIAYDYEWLFVALDLTAIPIRPFMCDLHCSTAMALFTILFFPSFFPPIDCTESSAFELQVQVQFCTAGFILQASQFFPIPLV